jgi:hypothetical protein
MLDVVFALDRGLNPFVMLEVNEAFDGILLCESRDQAIPMFIDSSDEVVRDPYVRNSIWRASQNVNIATQHTDMMKDVDGRDKPGHDGV